MGDYEQARIKLIPLVQLIPTHDRENYILIKSIDKHIFQRTPANLQQLATNNAIQCLQTQLKRNCYYNRTTNTIDCP